MIILRILLAIYAISGIAAMAFVLYKFCLNKTRFIENSDKYRSLKLLYETTQEELDSMKSKYRTSIEEIFPNYGILPMLTSKSKPTSLIVVPQLPDQMSSRLHPYVMNNTAFIIEAEYLAFLKSRDSGGCALFSYMYGIYNDRPDPGWNRATVNFSPNHECYPITEIWSIKYANYINGLYDFESDDVLCYDAPMPAGYTALFKWFNSSDTVNVYTHSATSCRYVDIIKNSQMKEESLDGREIPAGEIEYH